MGGPKGKADKGKGKAAAVEKGSKGDGKGKGGKGKEKSGKGSKQPEGDHTDPEAAAEESPSEKPYFAALQEVFKTSAARPSDIDPKALQLLDALHEHDKAEAACKHLCKFLEGQAREKVLNWKAYVFTLLRGFDRPIYEAMRDSRGRPRVRLKKEDKAGPPASITEMNAQAAEFVPGTAWKASAEAPEFVPGVPWKGVPLPLGQEAAAAVASAGAKSPKSAASAEPASPKAAKSPKGGKSPKAAKSPGGGAVFCVECKTDDGETVKVVGSSEALGKWDVKGGKEMSCEGAVWKSAAIQLDSDVEYKFVVVKGDGSARWEETVANRQLKGGDKPPAVAKFGAAAA